MKTLLRGMPTFQIQLSIQADLMTRGMGFGAPELAQFVLARVSVNCHALARREGINQAIESFRLGTWLPLEPAHGKAPDIAQHIPFTAQLLEPNRLKAIRKTNRAAPR